MFGEEGPVASPIAEPRVTELRKVRDSFKVDIARQRQRWWVLNLIVIGAGILFSIAVIVVGLYDKGRLAALFGALTAAAIAVQNGYAAGEKAEFYRLVVAEAENLLSDLALLINTGKEFEATVKALEALRTHAAKALPRGSGMEAVKQLGADLERAKRNGT